MARKANNMVDITSEDEVVSVKFNVDVLLIKDENDDTYHPLNFTKDEFNNPESSHPLSKAELFNKDEGFKFWKLDMIYQSEGLVKAGQTIKMKYKEAKEYLDGWRQVNGHRDPKVFVTYETDPNIFKGFPVAELVS